MGTAMRHTSFETVRLMSPVTAKTIWLCQVSPRWPEVMRLLVIAPLGFLLLKAATMFSAHIWANSAAKMALLANPAAMMQIAIAFLAFLTVFLWQASIAVTRLVAKRTVRIDAANVRVTDRSLFGKQTWTAPLRSYSGLVRQTRTTLGGSVTTTLLAHDDNDRSVLLAAGPPIAANDIDALVERFQLPELSASAWLLRQHLTRANPQVSGMSYGRTGGHRSNSHAAAAAS